MNSRQMMKRTQRDTGIIRCFLSFPAVVACMRGVAGAKAAMLHKARQRANPGAVLRVTCRTSPSFRRAALASGYGPVDEVGEGLAEIHDANSTASSATHPRSPSSQITAVWPLNTWARLAVFRSRQSGAPITGWKCTSVPTGQARFQTAHCFSSSASDFWRGRLIVTPPFPPAPESPATSAPAPRQTETSGNGEPTSSSPRKRD